MVGFVFDGVGGETLERSWSMLRLGGKRVTIATRSAAAADQRIRDTFMLVEPILAQLMEIGRLIDAGELRALVAEEYPLAAAPSAYERARAGPHARQDRLAGGGMSPRSLVSRGSSAGSIFT